MSDFASTRTDVTGLGATLGTATTTKSGGVATFTVNGADVQVQVARDLTVGVGDVCLIQRSGAQWFAVQRFYTAAPAVVDNAGVPAPRPPAVSGTLVCTPVETRSYRPGGWRTDTGDIVQGQTGGSGLNSGCAFYGTVPASLTGATVISAQVLVRRPSRGGVALARALTLWLVTETTLPSGAPTLTLSTAGPSLAWGGQSRWPVPTSWAQAMVDGTAGGLAVYEADGDPYVVLSGRSDFLPAFALSIDWSR